MTERIAADASATRGFFVDMLVRDISVDGAILDLVDNAVDAAYKLSAGSGDLRKFNISVTFSHEQFRIEDNCGGIDIDDARDNVFRFGRPPGFDPQTRIGQFGIGMKRAVFRIGRRFKVESSTTEKRFSVDVDVEDWREQDGDWKFPMLIDDDPDQTAGTAVTVDRLHEGVREHFSTESYARTMLREIAARYDQVLAKGMEITLNGQAASIFGHELLFSKNVTPEHQEYELETGGHKVRVRIVAGIAPARRPAAESGWYVYCNGRLVVEADRTHLTGWGTGDVDGRGESPAWHTQYRRFRGFVFFESEHPNALPWTTTKNEIDRSAVAYRKTLAKMRLVIRSFTSYTNAEKQEREQFEEGDGSAPDAIAVAVKGASNRSVAAILEEPRTSFSVPERQEVPSVPEGPSTAIIQFRAEVSRIDELKQALNLKSNRLVGETAFDRLYEEEIV